MDTPFVCNPRDAYGNAVDDKNLLLTVQLQRRSDLAMFEIAAEPSGYTTGTNNAGVVSSQFAMNANLEQTGEYSAAVNMKASGGLIASYYRSQDFTEKVVNQQNRVHEDSVDKTFTEVVGPLEIQLVDQPPVSTRAYFRGRCLQKYPDDIVAANWDSLVFDVGRDPLRRVPMMEPLRGTADHVATLIDQSETAGELLDRLGQ